MSTEGLVAGVARGGDGRLLWFGWKRARDGDRLAVVGADAAGTEEADVPCAEAELELVRTDLLMSAIAAIGWGRSDSEVALRARMSLRTFGEAPA
ncbi:hypothetical protein ACGFZB_26035 [Streptomyces cinerochromogenes]|uniref:Uncharacterized protein n=1 Tax=Streptomyces cinerochromogenes TaxID=66422 RepID=A0ABW7B9F3_9ACTN